MFFLALLHTAFALMFLIVGTEGITLHSVYVWPWMDVLHIRLHL